jgi:hypothetical protein
MQLDVCQQPTCTQNSVTIDIQVRVYPDMFQCITLSGGACKHPLRMTL